MQKGLLSAIYSLLFDQLSVNHAREYIRTWVNAMPKEFLNSDCNLSPIQSYPVLTLLVSSIFKQSKSSDSFDFPIPNFWELRTRQEKHWTEKTYWPTLESFNCLQVTRGKKKVKWNCSLLHKEHSQTPSSFMPTLQIHLSTSWRMHQEFQRQADINFDRTHSSPMRSKL